jgi:hypothetical protein
MATLAAAYDGRPLKPAHETGHAKRPWARITATPRPLSPPAAPGRRAGPVAAAVAAPGV